MTDLPVTAYRHPSSPDVLLCWVHGRTHADWRSVTPLDADDLPDGGICSECHTDVLILPMGDAR